MANTNVKNSFNRLLQFPPHKDITTINKFIVSGSFTRSSREIFDYIKKVGYESDITSIFKYINLIKSQLNLANETFGDEVDIDFFCDVAGTSYFEHFICTYGQDSFFDEMAELNPMFNFKGHLSKIKQNAFMALKNVEFKKTGDSVSLYLGALEVALKRIGVNPNDEINGVSKSIIALLYVMNTIGGTMLYLPKGDALNRVITDVDIYIDNHRMDAGSVALKYGVTYKTVSIASKRVREAIKLYEG